MADMYEKLLGLGGETTTAAPAPPDDPYAQALLAQEQGAGAQAPPATVTQGEWQGPPPPPPPESGVLSTIGHSLYGLGKGAIAGTLGWPGNILAGMPWTSYERKLKELPPGVEGPPELLRARPVTHYVNPLPRSETVREGVDWLAKQTGLYTPPTPGTPEATGERLSTTLGEVVGPSKLIPGGKMPEVRLPGGFTTSAREIAGLSVGKLQDFWVGLQALVGEEAARAIWGGKSAEELEHTGQIGKGVAPMVYALVHGLLSKGLQRSGRFNLPQQVDLPRAETALKHAETGLAETSEQYAARLAAMQERNRLRQEGEGARLVPLTAAQEAEQARVAAAQAQAGQQTAQAEKQAGLATQMADEQSRLAAGQVKTPQQLEAEALAPLPPVVESVGPTPGVREPGAQLQQAIVEQADTAASARATAQTQATEKLVSDIGPKLEDAAFIDLNQKDLRPKFLKQRQVVGKAFDEVENQLGTQRVVELTTTRAGLRRLAKEAQASGQDVSPQYAQWAELGLSKKQLATLEGTSGLERMHKALQMVPEEKLTFAAARDIENTLNAAGSGAPVGSLKQAPPRFLARAVGEDLNTFFSTDLGTGSGPALQLAKSQYRDFLTTWNNGIMRHLVDPGAGYQAQNFISFLSNTSRAQIPQLRAVMRQAAPETQAAISAHVAADMAHKATDTVTGVIKPAALKAQVQRLQKSGVFREVFDETQQKQIVDAVNDMTGKDTSLLPQFRKAMEGKDPEAVVPFIFEPGKVTRTEQYQTIAPEQFPLARQAWARKFLQDYEAGGAPAVQGQLTKMLREDDGVSQLAIMFPEHEFPGVLDQFKQAAADLRSAPARAQATSERAELLKEGAKETKRLSAGATELVTEAGQRTVDAAQARLDAATQKVTEAQERLESMRATGTKQEGRQKAHQALALKRATEEKHAAQQAVKDLEATAAKSSREGLIRRGLSNLVGGGGATFAFLYGMTHSTPMAPYMLATGGLGIALEGARWAMPAFARTKVGEQLMRHGLPQHYGEGAARWVHQVFVNTPEQQEGEPADATAP